VADHHEITLACKHSHVNWHSGTENIKPNKQLPAHAMCGFPATSWLSCYFGFNLAKC